MTLNNPTINKFRSVPALTEALKEQPGYRGADAVWHRTNEILTDLLRKRDELPPELDYDEILDSGTLPKDWLQSIASAQSDRDELARQIEAIDRLRGSAEHRLETIAAEPEAILSTLGGWMTDVVSRVHAAVDGLAGASTPGEAIHRGVTDEWRELAAARDRYLQLRTAQQRLMTASAADTWRRARTTTNDDGRVSYGHIRNLDEVFPEYSFRASTPWPDDETEFLIWCVRNGAELWLPGAWELSEHVTERKQYFYAQTQELAALARRNSSEVTERINAGQVHPYVQRELRNRGLL